MHEHDCDCVICSITRDVDNALRVAAQQSGLSPSEMLKQLRAEAEQTIAEQREQSTGQSMSREQWRAQAKKRGYYLLEVETGMAALSPQDVAWLKAQHISLD